MGFSLAAYFLVWIGTEFLSALLRPKNNVNPGEITVPTAEENRPIPMVYGTCKIESPNVVWYGDLKLDEIKRGGFLGFSFGGDVIGYFYSLGVQYGLCIGPIDAIVGVEFDDRPAPYSVADHGTYKSLTFSLPTFFGGEGPGGEGGLGGTMDFYLGGSLQDPNDYLEAKRGMNLPAYRGLCYAVCRQMYFGLTPVLKKFSPIVKRVPNGLGLTGGKHDIGGDANPACIIYDVLTAPQHLGGLAFSQGVIDVTAMRAAGDQLHAEGLGLSMVLDSQVTGWDFLKDILTHIDGVLFTDPATGLFTLKLIRFDYDPNDLLILNPSNCRLTAFHRPTWDEVRTDVLVKYRDRTDGFQIRPAQFHELAVFELRGGQSYVEEMQLLGFSNATNAQKAAARAGVALCYPWASMSLEVNRLGWNLRPGSVVKLDWPPLGISGMVIRIGHVSSGTLVDGRMPLEAVEDLFAVSWTAYTPPPPSGWVDPVTDVEQLEDQAAIGAPYEAVKMLSPGPESQSRALVMAARGPGVTLGYKVYVRRTDSSWPPPSLVITSMTPAGLLLSSIAKNQIAFEIYDGPDTASLVDVSDADFAAGGNLLWIDDEFIVFKTIVRLAGSFQLYGCVRGCIDTVPQNHAAGKRVWFLSYGAGLANVNTVQAPFVTLNNYLRFQAYNSRSEIDFASAPEEILLTKRPDRAALPYAPTKVWFNGFPYPPDISGELTVSWAHRNRLASWSYTDAGITPGIEPGANYTIKVYGELDTLVHTETGLTGTSWTYPMAMEIAESGLGRLNNHLRVQIYSVKGLDSSWQAFEWEFDRV